MTDQKEVLCLIDKLVPWKHTGASLHGPLTRSRPFAQERLPLSLHR